MNKPRVRYNSLTGLYRASNDNFLPFDYPVNIMNQRAAEWLNRANRGVQSLKSHDFHLRMETAAKIFKLANPT